MGRPLQQFYQFISTDKTGVKLNPKNIFEITNVGLSLENTLPTLLLFDYWGSRLSSLDGGRPLHEQSPWSHPLLYIRPMSHIYERIWMQHRHGRPIPLWEKPVGEQGSPCLTRYSPNGCMGHHRMIPHDARKGGMSNG
jgi:hypothetical protein